MITGATVNVLDYGAKGDGSTDDTTAIQNAINTGLNIFFPKGSYIITTALTVFAAGQRLFGEARGNTTITQTNVGQGGIIVNNKNDVQIENLYLAATGSNTAAGLLVTTGCINSAYYAIRVQGFYYGIKCLNSNQTYFNNIFLVNNRSHGMYLSGVSGSCVDTTVMNAYVAGNGTAVTANGLYVEGVCSGIYFTKCQFQLSSNFGILIEQGGGSGTASAGFFTQCINDTNTAGGVKMSDGLLFEFNNCWTSGLGDGYYFGSNVADAKVIGGEIYNMGGHGVNILESRCSVVGTNIRGAGRTTANTYDGIRINGASSAIVSGVNFDGEYSGSNVTRYGISLTGGTVNNTYITGCNFINMATGTFINENNSALNNRFLDQYQGVSGVVTNTSTATLYTFPAQRQANYLFFCGQVSNINGGIRAMALVRVGSTSIGVTSLAAVGGATLSASGMAVQVTNTAGGDVTFDYSWIKL